MYFRPTALSRGGVGKSIPSNAQNIIRQGNLSMARGVFNTERIGVKSVKYTERNISRRKHPAKELYNKGSYGKRADKNKVMVRIFSGTVLW